MLKKLLFQLHWFVGITAGIVLAVVGVTGALLSFEHETLRWINPGVMRVAAQTGNPLSAPDLLAKLQDMNPERTIVSLSISSEPTDTARVSFALTQGSSGSGRGRTENRYVDPYSAELLGQPRGQAAFREIRQWHRWLAAGEIGKQIVGASTLLLVGLALTGLYLRWPRRPLNWRSWFRLDVSRKGRAFLWELHSVIGAWVMIPYLIMSLSGLFWSYTWYRDLLYVATGTTRPAQIGPPGAQAAQQDTKGPGQRDGAQTNQTANAARTMLDTREIWAIFLRESGGYSSATLRPAANPNLAYQISYQTPSPAHERANNTLMLDPVTGDVRSHRRYADLSPGQTIMASIFALHSGGFFGLPGVIVFMLASMMMPLFAITGWLLYIQRRRISRSSAQITHPARTSSVGRAPERSTKASP